MIDKASGAFKTISEVSAELDVPPHVLRFWETKFSNLRPLKRSGSRRYYRPNDVAALIKIRNLLYRDGYTIRGAQRLLKTKHVTVDAEDQSGHEKIYEESIEKVRAQLDSALNRLSAVKRHLNG